MRPGSGSEGALPLRRAAGLAALAVAVVALAACSTEGSGGPAAPEPAPSSPDLLGNPVAGKAAFVANCSSCHTSGDGFDLAHFGFTPLDVIRRGLAHVDSATARDIAAHIESLDVERRTRIARPFQPGGRVRGERPGHSAPGGDQDRAFWMEVFGTGGWPEGLRADDLRAIDPAGIPVPLDMPRWSVEGSDEDWMPDVPLPLEVREHGGGAVASALDDYRRHPSESSLIAAIARFREATNGPGLLCWRADPFPCFNARRWMASLAAIHYLRLGEGTPVPPEVARTWWEVGESGIAIQTVTRGEERDAAFRSGARWMYMAFAVAPETFREPAEYMGTFLGSQDLNRVALFATLRRMVGNGLAHAEFPDQFIEDGRLAVKRADVEVDAGVTEFVFQHLVDRLESGVPSGLDVVRARRVVEEILDAARRIAVRDPVRWARIGTLHQRVLELLD